MNPQPNRKTYGTPLYVAQKVRQFVDSNPELVLEAVWNRFAERIQQEEFREQYGVNEDWHRHHRINGPHERGCGCAYCNALSRYIVTKVSAHRLQRILDNSDYMCRPYDPTDYRHLKELQEEWVRLRDVKNQMKVNAGL